MRKKLLSLLLAGIATPAMAQTIPSEIVAEQAMHDFNTGGYALGQSGNGNFKVAQTFQMSRTGMVTHIMLPIFCSTAQTVRVTLQAATRAGFPSGAVLSWLGWSRDLAFQVFARLR